MVKVKVRLRAISGEPSDDHLMIFGDTHKALRSAGGIRRPPATLAQDGKIEQAYVKRTGCSWLVVDARCRLANAMSPAAASSLPSEPPSAVVLCPLTLFSALNCRPRNVPMILKKRNSNTHSTSVSAKRGGCFWSASQIFLTKKSTWL